MNQRSIALDVVLVLVWLFILGDSLYQAIELPSLFARISDKLPELPIALMLAGALIIPATPCCLTFWQRRNLMEDMPFLSAKMDQWFFEGAYRYLMSRLYPVHASIIASFIIGSIGGWITFETSTGIWSGAVCLGSLLFSVYMLVTVALSKRYPPILK